MNIINNEMKISMILNYLYFWTSYFDNKEIMDDDEKLYNNFPKYVLCNKWYGEEVEGYIKHESRWIKKIIKKIS